MQTQNMRDEQLEAFAKVVEGWTITKVEHNEADEGMITLRLENVSRNMGHRRKTVRVWATDLGWWHKVDKQKKPKPTRKPGKDAP